MSKLEQLVIERRSRKKKKRKLTTGERRKQTRDWCTFYRRNWNIYAKHELEMGNLHFFQEIILYLIGVSNVFFLMCGRGLSKTFLSGLSAVIQCMLYPYSEVVLTATTLRTANKMVKEKIENEICGRFSPKLKWLKDNGYITFDYNKEEIIVNFTFNKSWIKILPSQDSSRGERTSFLIFEEARMLKKAIVDSVFKPMRHSRIPRYRLLDRYKDNKDLIERTKIIYLTSTRYKHEWFWEQWKKSVNNMFSKDSKLIYSVMCGDIETAIHHNFMTRDDFEGEKGDSSEVEVMMEYYNEPQGEIEGSFYSLEMFQQNRIIGNAFIPPTPDEYIVKYLRGDIPFFRPEKEGEIRAIYVDFAFTDTTNKNQVNDNTVIGCMSGFPNEDRSRILRNCEYMETYSGGKKDESILRIRELFYLYGADVLICDTRNGGEDRLVDLTKPYYHEEFGIEMNGFGIYDKDEILNFYCDKSKVDNLRSRVVDPHAIPVVIPVIGTDERNNNYHIAMKNALTNKTMRFLVDEMTKKSEIGENEEYIKMNSNEKMRTLLGHVQLDIMILSEAIKLQQVIKKGFISLITVGSNKRDRIVATEYANYFFYLKELEMIKEQSSDDCDISQWQLWG